MLSKEDLELVENYLTGQLPAEQTADFEKRLQNEPLLAQEVKEQRILHTGFQVYGQRTQLKQRLSAIHEEMEEDEAQVKRPALDRYAIRIFWKKHLPTMAVAASVALLTVFSALFTLDYVHSLENKQINDYRALSKQIKQTQQRINSALRPAIPSNVRQERYSATGFVVSANGYLVTDYHVIEKADSVYIESNTNGTLRYKVKEVYSDPTSDLSILKIVDSTFSSFGQLPYTFKASESDLGEPVYTLAFPREDMVYGEGSISSKTGFEGDTTAYQISIPVNPGNSGGPLIDEKGHLVGIIKGKNMAEDGATFAVKRKHLLKLIRSIPKDSLTEPLVLPKTNRIKKLKRPDQIKQMQNLVFNVKVYH